jgi:putative pyrroloquinoline-quinone binding quinoprotein
VLVRALDGSLVYQWGGVDSPGWNKVLLGPVLGLSGGTNVVSASACETDKDPGANPGTAERIVCLITDGGTRYSDDTGSLLQEVASTTTSVIVLDIADGAMLAQWAAPGVETFALLPDQVVVGSTGDDADVFSGRDLLTGDALWTAEVAVPAEAAGDGQPRRIGAERVGDLVALTTSSHDLQLVSADGRVVRRELVDPDASSWGWEVDPSGDRLILASGDASGKYSLHLFAPDRDPSADITVEGTPVSMPVDDGSVPGLLLTVDTAVHAWHAETGAERWTSTDPALSADDGQQPSAIVVRGDVYVISPTGLVALDGGTGKTLWLIPAEAGLVPQVILTDARHLLVGYTRLAHDGDSVVVAYDFSKGTEAFRARYPTGISFLTVWNSTLLGFDDDGTIASLG